MQGSSLHINENERTVVSTGVFFRAFFAFSIIFPSLSGTLAIIVGVFRIFHQCVVRPTNLPRLLFFMALVSYILAHGVFYILQSGSLSNPEIKILPILFGIACLGLLRNIGTNYRFETFIFRIITLFTIVGLTLSVTSSGAVLRFPDHLPFKYGFISIYYGSVCVLFFAFNEDKRRNLIYFLYVILSGSGTALLGALVVLAFRIAHVSFGRKAFFIAGILLLFTVLQVTQAQRGRDLSDLETIDRFVIQTGYVSWLQDVASPTQILFGCGIACDMESMPRYIELDLFRAYLVAEADGFLSGRNLHSDHLRLFNHFGLIGWALAVLTLYRALHGNKRLFWAIMAMCSLNSILTTTPFFIALLTSLRPER